MPGLTRKSCSTRRAADALLLTAFIAAGCSKAPDNAGAAAAAPRAVPVSVVSPRVEKIVRRIEVVGTLWADEDALIACKVSGKLATLEKDVGDTIASGEVLGKLLTTDYVLAVRQRELAIRETLSKIGMKEIPVSDFDPEAVPVVARAKAQAANAASRFARGKSLFEQNPPRISEQEYEDLRTALEVAKRDLEVEVLQAKAVVEEARARQGDLDVANQRLEDTHIRAPRLMRDDGKPRTYAVASRMVTVGEFVREGTPVFRLIDSDIIKLRARVPERYSQLVRIGQKVTLKVESSTDTQVGRVTRINPQVDPANRTFEVEVESANPGHTLKPGAFAKAWIETREDPHVVFVPQDSVISFAGVNKVFVIDAGVAHESVVTLGDRLETWIEVSEGIKGDESVVTAGASKLAEGMKVAVVAPTTQAASTAPASGDAGEGGR